MKNTIRMNLITYMVLSGLIFIFAACNTPSYISKKGEDVKDKFPTSEYADVFYMYHSTTEAANLAYSSDLELVKELWVPKDMSGKPLNQMADAGWKVRKKLSKGEIRRMRSLFVDQGKQFWHKSCSVHAFNRSLVFVGENNEITGVIYFCPEGYSLEARPSLRPGVSPNYIWGPEGMELFHSFIKKLDKKLTD